tara:strand:- start:1524 stop:2045 length:522 start_codon:yes stop_codon:yes gene_type:complete
MFTAAIALNHDRKNCYLLISLIYICTSSSAIADTIYQWTDPWGQVQYSKTPEPGSMISELTELPETKKTTEQQKLEAILRSKRKMNEVLLRREKKNSTQQLLKAQTKLEMNYCNKLRNMLADIQLKATRNYFGFGGGYGGYDYFLPYNDLYAPIMHFESQANDLNQEIRKNCR